MAFKNVYKGARVFVTGHTGFKGSWLCEWLLELGAEVFGYSLQPPSNPSLFHESGLGRRLAAHVTADVRDQAALAAEVTAAKPDFIFHFAAQPLVRLSYDLPVETYAVNVMGTAHLLETVRKAGRPCVVVVATTDKCYENREWVHAYREEDKLGGFDPYSSSKAAAELLVSAYRQSYFAHSPVRLASARAGNVIGGGDWALDRIVPDSIRALVCKRPVVVRRPTATRPWQHVLEPLSGYLWLAARLQSAGASVRHELESAFNFGPELSSNQPVGRLMDEILRHWPGTWISAEEEKAPHEAGRLNLAIDKARHCLDWHPVWDFAQTVEFTMQWYKDYYCDPSKASSLTRSQVAEYMRQASVLRLAWT